MPPRSFGVGAPQCARCGKSVYMAEQVIGPYSKPYHKPCLTCIVCNKRLDSTLLVEHEGEPFCKNCHKTHLGQGKGGFALSVPLRPEKPAALRGQANSSASKSADDEYNEKLSGISVTPKKKSHTSNETHEEPPTPLRTPTMRANLSRPTTVAQSIDDLVASGVEVPIPHNRNSLAANSINKEVYGSAARTSTNPSHEQDQELLFANEEPLTRQFTSSREAESIEKSSQKSYFTPDSTDEYLQPSTPPSREAFASFRQDAGGLPSPQRKDPIALTREREKGLAQLGGAGAAKTYSPRTTPMSPNQSANTDKSNEYGYAPNSALTKMGLGSTVNAAAVGTPLCARCERPVYFAEQKQAAGRKWHRGCLRCDGCSTTLESGKLEEGPVSATYKFPTNVWCRTCYAKRFGPKGIGVAGMSLPEV